MEDIIVSFGIILVIIGKIYLFIRGSGCYNHHMETKEKNKIRKLYFDVKPIQDEFPITRKDLTIALRYENVTNSSIMEYDFIDPIFIQTMLYRGNIKVKEHFSLVYRKIAREVIGLDLMLRHLEKIAPKKSDLSVSLILKLHSLIFDSSWPDIAGKFRDCDVRIRGIKARPPHPSQVSSLTYQHLGWVDGLMKLLGPVTESNFFEIFHVSADIHYRLIETYPFRSGNWRIARALSNYVFQNCGMFPNVIDFDKRADYLEAVGNSTLTALEPLVEFLLANYYETIIKVKGFLELIKNEAE